MLRIHGGDQTNLAVRPGADGHIGTVGQGDGQAEPGVVIRVLADQIDPAGGAPDALGILAIDLLEELPGLGRPLAVSALGPGLYEFNCRRH